MTNFIRLVSPTRPKIPSARRMNLIQPARLSVGHSHSVTPKTRLRSRRARFAFLRIQIAARQCGNVQKPLKTFAIAGLIVASPAISHQSLRFRQMTSYRRI